VVNDVGGSPLLKSHLESVEDELGAQVSGHGPSDNSAAPCIEHDRQVEESRPCGPWMNLTRSPFRISELSVR